MKATMTVNGKSVEAEGHPSDRLLDILRLELGLIGSKEGCGEGECGACTVIVDGEPVLSCLIPRLQCEGREVVTVEGVAAAKPAFFERLIAEGGIQCGACTPGIVVTLAALLEHEPEAGRERVREALAGNLCRCTGYEGIFRAFEAEP